MLKLIKWLLFIPVLLLTGYIVADKANMSARAHQLVGVDVLPYGAICTPDWHALNPLGCRYRYQIGPENFAKLAEQELTPARGWKQVSDTNNLAYPHLQTDLSEDSLIFINKELPNRTRWVTYLPTKGLLLLGFHVH